MTNSQAKKQIGYQGTGQHGGMASWNLSWLDDDTRWQKSLIPSDRRGGCIVDIGCGTLPLFLAGTEFAEKIGVDKSFNSGAADSFVGPGFRLIEHDIEDMENCR